MFLMVQGIQRDKKVAHVISEIESKVYMILKNVLAPVAPKDSTLATIKNTITNL